MEKELKLQYFERLIARNYSDLFFIEQFLKGSGNELAKKFWSEKSSSRLCFDLYSWLCKEDGIKNFQFEKHLPGVLVGENKMASPPNMDVFFEKGEDVIFIESKYTERSDWKYKNDKLKDGFHLSEAYWGKDGYKSCKLDIGQRFYNNVEIANQFSDFCEKIQTAINKYKSDNYKSENVYFQWFDPKQETCHLFGIIFYVINNKIKNKNIHLCNNVWKCDNDSFDCMESIVGIFKDKAEMMLNNIFKEQNCPFVFEVHTIQDILENGFMGLDFADARLFAMEEECVKNYIFAHYNYKETQR